MKVLDTPVVCPVCGHRWSTETDHSWWLDYDRCTACLAEATPATRYPDGRTRLASAAECEPFRIGQLHLFA